MSLQTEQKGASLIFIFFVCIGVLMLSIASRMKLTSEAISIFSPFAEYRIKWNEIILVEFAPEGRAVGYGPREGNIVGDGSREGNIVFHGVEKQRLFVPSSTVWSGLQKNEAHKFMKEQIKYLGIKVEISSLADFKIHNNVRVKSA